MIEGRTVVVDAYVENDDSDPEVFDITCQLHKVKHHLECQTAAVMQEVNPSRNCQVERPVENHKQARDITSRYDQATLIEYEIA